jgi:large subunit ribosomal protein L15
MELSKLKPKKGARHAKKRVGRGPGSGHGKTAGRGEKGQKSRSGYSRMLGFEGGQMPLHRRLPKRGFTNIFASDFNEVNLGRLQEAFEAGKLDAGKPVTVEALVEAGVCARARDGVKILGNGELKTKATFEVVRASKSAIAAIEKAGGSVKLLGAEANA